MCQPSKYINEICPECNPRTSVKTQAEYAGEVNTFESHEADGSVSHEKEYLYACTKCGARMWVDERCAKENEVTE